MPTSGRDPVSRASREAEPTLPPSCGSAFANGVSAESPAEFRNSLTGPEILSLARCRTQFRSHLGLRTRVPELR